METEHCGLLIVGAGHAGSELAVAARQAGWADDIVLAGDETSLPYERPPLTKAVLADAAIGLIAAIPATIFYNKFTSEVNRQAQRLEGFADEFSAILSRQIDERA